MEKRENEVREVARFRMSVRVVLLTLNAANVKVVSDSNVSLTQAGNDATTIAASLSAANKAFSYTDTNGVSVGQVTADSTVTAGRR